MTRRISIVGLGLGLALAGLVAPSSGSAASEECGTRACVAGAKWASGESLSEAERERERKRNRKRKNAQLTVQTNNRRGSLFVDGIWIAPVPALYVPITAGKHEVEVRDGEAVLVHGVLTVSSKGGDVTMRVF